MYLLASPIITAIAAERRKEALDRAAQTRRAREIRLGAHSAARHAIRPAAGRSFPRFLSPRVPGAAA